MGEMAVMDRTGDTRVIWDPGNDAEVSAAREQFRTLTGKGFMAYRVNREGGKGQQIRDFDPDAEKIILAPPLVGG